MKLRRTKYCAIFGPPCTCPHDVKTISFLGEIGQRRCYALDTSVHSVFCAVFRAAQNISPRFVQRLFDLNVPLFGENTLQC